MDWTTEGSIVYSSEGVVWQVSAAGGEPRRLTEQQDDDLGHRDPLALPGGNAILFMTTMDGRDVIVAQSLEAPEMGEKRILVEGTSPRYASSGHLLFDRGGSIWGVPFDVERLELRGEPVPFVENVETNANGYARFQVSAEGTLVYVPRRTTQSNQLVWVDRVGGAQPLGEERGAYSHPRTDLDGGRVTVTIGDDESDVWVYEVERGTRVRLTASDGRNTNPIWSLDAERVYFASNRADAPGIYARAASGSGDEELISRQGVVWPYFTAPDGTLVIGHVNAGTSYDIATLSPDGEPSALLASSAIEGNAAISPDGRWMAYQTTESGTFEIQVQSFPDLGGKRVVSTEGGTEPAWSRDGSELFYRNNEQMMVVAVELGDELRLGEPRVLFEGSFAFAVGGLRNYDASPDGERFLMVQSGDSSGLRTFHVVLNFFDELERVFSAN